MSPMALARKWRPKTFSELIGQPHVVEALTHALAQQRLHHAYLFAGTRGVGKTTLGRLFAKALNCEKGVTPEPCGQCDVCRSVDEGRFVDLIEIDAASRTRVEDTREILDNVQYAPTQGRFKVYLIDEVHMLSVSSFNALLKTLEEPPEHVKFILATTDPHRLPATVLSRCLKFNLMRVQPAQIAEHLARIVAAEGVEAEPAALQLIAHQADGSVRDALSLLDQAIAQGAGHVRMQTVRDMLGLAQPEQLAGLLTALAEGDPEGLQNTLARLARVGTDYGLLLDSLLAQLHLIAMLQLLGRAAPDQDVSLAQSFVDRLSPEQVQLCYQIGLQGQQMMQWAPDPRVGFEMTLLRMLAFEPVMTTEEEARAPSARGRQEGEKPAARAADASASPNAGGPAAVQTLPPSEAGTEAEMDALIDPSPLVNHDAPSPQPALETSEKESLFAALKAQLAGEVSGEASLVTQGEDAAAGKSVPAAVRPPVTESIPTPEDDIPWPALPPEQWAETKEAGEAAEEEEVASPAAWLSPPQWRALLQPLALTGVLRELAWATAARWVGTRLEVAVHPAQQVLQQQRGEALLQALRGLAQSVRWVSWPESGETIAAWEAEQQSARRQAARQRFMEEAGVQRICRLFDARPIESSIDWKQQEGA